MDTSVTKMNAADNTQLLEEKKVVYSSNGKYDPQEINKLVKVYHMALEAGDNATVQDAFTQIYYFIKNYVYKTLWDIAHLCRTDITRKTLFKMCGLRFFRN